MAEEKVPKGPKITLDEGTVTSLLEEAKVLVTAIDSFKTERAALEANTRAELVLTDEDVQWVHACFLEADEARRTWGAIADQGSDWIAQKVTEAIDKVHKGSTIETLRDQLVEKVNRAKVIADMLGLEIETPAVPTASTKSAGGSKPVKVGNARFYRVIDGEKTYQSAAQNSLSSLAWYYSSAGSEDGKRMPVKDFVALLVANGLDDKVMSKPWGPIDVGLHKDKLIQVGMDVTEDKPAEEAPAPPTE